MTFLQAERDPIDVHMGGRLRQVRASRRMSLEELGRRIGVTYQQIQKYETGANRISAATLFRIAEVFDTTPAYFFDGLSNRSAKTEEPATNRETLQSSVAFGRIPDPEVRHRLRALIDALDPGAAR